MLDTLHDACQCEGGVLDAPCDAPHDGDAPYHCKPTYNIDIYPSTSGGCIRCPHDAPHSGGVRCPP